MEPKRGNEMPSLTLKSIPDELMDRLRRLADEERRSLNQQAILLLEEALEKRPRPFSELYDQFLKSYGPSPLDPEDLDGLRDRSPGRE